MGMFHMQPTTPCTLQRHTRRVAAADQETKIGTGATRLMTFLPDAKIET
jgi:hypothetical protein